MIRKLLLVGAVALAGAIALPAAFSVSAQEGPPPLPSSAPASRAGCPPLVQRSGRMGRSDVPIGGEAATAVTVPAEFVEQAGTDTVYFGTTGAVARVDVATGEVTTYAEGLPVSAFEAGKPGSGSN